MRCDRRLSSRAFFFMALLATGVEAGGPLGLTDTEVPFAWNNQTPVLYSTDQGTLGQRTNAQANQLITESFAMWTSLANVELSATRVGNLAADVNAANNGTFIGQQDGITPIIYDSDGSITIAMGEDPSEVLGFAAPEYVDDVTGQIVEGYAVLNGQAFDTLSDNAVKLVMVHEIGHMLGLSHSQVNQEFYFDGNGANDALVPIMYPFLRSRDDPEALPTLSLDDEMSMAWLYRKPNFLTGFGNLTGKVSDRVGQPVRGANVVVRRITGGSSILAQSLGIPVAESFSWPSGIAQKTGADFEFHLLPAGNYEVFIEPIDQDFVGGSRIGEFLSPPQDIVPEYWNGESESADTTVDDAEEVTPVTVTVGQTATEIDFITQSGEFLNLALNGSVSSLLESVSGAVPDEQFRIAVPAVAEQITLTLTTEGDANVDLHLRQTTQVTALVAPGAAPLAVTSDLSSTGAGGSETLVMNETTTPGFRGSTYFLALVNNTGAPVRYTLVATTSNVAATTTGTGATSGVASRSGSGRFGGCQANGSEHGPGPVGYLAFLPLLALLVGRSRALRRRRPRALLY